MDANDESFDDDFESDVAALQRDMRVRQGAKRRFAEELWTPPPMPTTLLDQMSRERPKVDWIVQDVAPAGIMNMNAEAKCGKTTVILSAVYALAMNEPFLGKFTTTMKPTERVGILNMELPEEQFNSWFDRMSMSMSDEAMGRIEIYHALTHGFRALDFSNDRAVEWLIKWLKDSEVVPGFVEF